MSTHNHDEKRELETMMHRLGYGDADFRVKTLGGDISSTARIELEVLEEKFEGTFTEIYQALSQSETARQVIEHLSSSGLRRRVGDDG